MDEIEVGGHRIGYERKGDGPPLILLHGWPMDGREWRRQIDGLSDEFTVVAWDAPGAGRSSDPPESFLLADWAGCLAAFIDALGLGPSHVCGLSWGGGLALELYGRHPDVVRTLILASAYAGWRGSLSTEDVDQRLRGMLRNTTLPPDRWARTLVETFFSEEPPAEEVREAVSIVSDLHPRATRVALRAFADADLRDVLPRIQVPTLLLCGEDDVRAPRYVWEALHSGIPGSKLVLIPGVGHVIDMEAPERFNAEVKAFLRSPR